MKKNKLSAMFIASVMTACVVPSFSANAGVPNDFSEEKFSDCIKLNDAEWLSVSSVKEDVYIDLSDDDGKVTMYFVGRAKDTISFTTCSGANQTEIENKIKAVDEDFLISWSKNADSTWNGLIQKSGNEIDRTESRKILNEVKEYVDSFDCRFNRYTYTYSVYDSLLSYEIFTDKPAEISDGADILESFAAEKGLTAKVDILDNKGGIYSCARLSMIPDEPLGIMEQYELAKDFNALSDLVPYGVSPTESGDNSFEEKVDAFNAVDGDANDDGELSLADAIFVLQSIGNPDEYHLTPQGRYNADIYNPGDGITTSDAVAIQQKLLGLID